MTSSDWVVYDDFPGAALDTRKWEARYGSGPDGSPVLLWDETAEQRVVDGEREVRIDKFTRSASDIQNLDNPKHLTVSTETFEIPRGGSCSFRASMCATKHRGGVDYRDGFATFNVIDVEHKLILDVLSTGERIHALYELQEKPVGVVEPEVAFLYVIDNPMLGADTAPGRWHQYEVSIDLGRQMIEVLLDGSVFFRTHDIPVEPRLIKIGMGILTLSPQCNGISTSIQGQGMTAGWRGISYRLQAARAS